MFINLTPHPVHIAMEDGATLTINPESVQARCVERIVQFGSHMGVPLVRMEYGEVTGLPDYDETQDVLYIVSLLVKQACPGRTDLVSPADMLRDEQGRVTGCRSLAINAQPAACKSPFEVYSLDWQEGQSAYTQVVIHRNDRGEPCLNVKLEKNTKGYNWEVTVTGARSVDEALALIETTRARLSEQYGGAPAA